jgi:RNA polymerase sigma-70 factor (ECF subfamily)
MVNEIRKGNQHVFYKAYDEYHERLYQYVFKYTRSTYLAEETVQLTFIKLWEKRENLSDEYSLSAQLFRISKSILIDLLRKEKLRQTQELSDIFIAAPVANDKVIYKEELEQVFSAIESLPAQSRRVFELSRLDNLSHKEISDRLSISTKTIENHISKALKYLRTNLTIFF